MFIHNDDKEFFRKCREIWNKITELIGITNAPDFAETSLDGDEQFIMVHAHKNTSFFEGNYRNKLIVVLPSLFNDQTSFVQHRYYTNKYTLIISISIKQKHIITACIPKLL